MNLNDRVWLLLNKKSPRRLVAYLNVVLPWLLIGVPFTFCLIALSVEKWLFLLGSLLLVLVLGAIFFLWDKRTGYLDAIHQHNLKRWAERQGRLGK